MISIPKSGGLSVFRGGFSGLPGGMDSSKSPDLIAEQYAALSVNLTFRGGKPKTRPKFSERDLGEADPQNLELFKNGLFQGGAAYYSTTLGRTILIGAYSGWILAMDVIGGTIDLLNPGDRNDVSRKHYILQAENFLLIQNGVDIPLIWNGTDVTARRSRTGTNNPVVGTANTNIVLVGTTATVSTTTAHGLAVDDYIQLDGVNVAGYIGQFYVTGTPTPTSYTITVDSTLAAPTIFGTTRLCPEIPIGLMMAYGQGRLFLTSSNRVEFTAGDIVYGDVNGEAGNILRWTENQYLAEGIAFRLPADQGRIIAMTFPTFQDSNTGQGELFVFGEYGVSSFEVSKPRADIVDPLTGAIIQTGWQRNQIQKITLSGAGASSQWSLVNFTNGDLFYRDLVGIRSYRNARGDLQSYGQTPISSEVNRILDNDVKTRLANISGCHFDNRMLMTCSPRFDARKVKISSFTLDGTTLTVETADDHGMENGAAITIGDTEGLDGAYTISNVGPTDFEITVPALANLGLLDGSYVTGGGSGVEIFHQGLVALDFTSTSGVGGKSSAAWDGVWCGIRFQQITSGFYDGKARCFSFVYGGVGDNQVWEITDEAGDDEPVGAVPTKIGWQLETRGYDFDKPFNKKKLRRLDMWLADLIGEVTMDIYYRTDGRACWTDWPPNWKRCATVSDLVLPETNENVEGLLQNRPQVRSQITMTRPPNVCNTVQGGNLSAGFDFQVRLVGTGRVTLDKVVLWVDDTVESPAATCPAGGTD